MRTEDRIVRGPKGPRPPMEIAPIEDTPVMGWGPVSREPIPRFSDPPMRGSAFRGRGRGAPPSRPFTAAPVRES